MKDELKEKLKLAGVDVESGVERFMSNEDLYWKFALRFLEDRNAQLLSEAFQNGDAADAFKAAHNLKGVCGNLSFMRLYEAVRDMTEPLRNGNLEEAKAEFPEFQENYRELTGILREYENEKEKQ